jgi:putative transposase
MKRARSAPYHPRTQGWIERWHQTLKSRILLENDFLPGRPRSSCRGVRGPLQPSPHHESLKNLTSANVYTGCEQTILLEWEKTKRRTMKLRRLQHDQSAV